MWNSKRLQKTNAHKGRGNEKINNAIPKLAITDSSTLTVAGILLCVDQITWFKKIFNLVLFNKIFLSSTKQYEEMKKEINSFSFKLVLITIS